MIHSATSDHVQYLPLATSVVIRVSCIRKSKKCVSKRHQNMHASIRDWIFSMPVWYAQKYFQYNTENVWEVQASLVPDNVKLYRYTYYEHIAADCAFFI